LNECCNRLSKTAFTALSKSDKQKWIVKRDEIISKFNQWLEDAGEAQSKRGLLVKRLESLGYKPRKSNGSIVFDMIQLIGSQENDSDNEDE